MGSIATVDSSINGSSSACSLTEQIHFKNSKLKGITWQAYQFLKHRRTRPSRYPDAAKRQWHYLAFIALRSSWAESSFSNAVSGQRIQALADFKRDRLHLHKLNVLRFVSPHARPIHEQGTLRGMLKAACRRPADKCGAHGVYLCEDCKIPRPDHRKVAS
jgi:hypothetical protein